MTLFELIKRLFCCSKGVNLSPEQEPILGQGPSLFDTNSGGIYVDSEGGGLPKHPAGCESYILLNQDLSHSINVDQHTISVVQVDDHTPPGSAFSFGNRTPEKNSQSSASVHSSPGSAFSFANRTPEKNSQSSASVYSSPGSAFSFANRTPEKNSQSSASVYSSPGSAFSFADRTPEKNSQTSGSAHSSPGHVFDFADTPKSAPKNKSGGWYGPPQNQNPSYSRPNSSAHNDEDVLNFSDTEEERTLYM